MKRVYFEDVLSVIKESIESVDENVYKDLIDECVRTLKNGGKIIASVFPEKASYSVSICFNWRS